MMSSISIVYLLGKETTLTGKSRLLLEGEEEYEVGHIRDIRKMGRTLKALVRWKGYGEGDNTWEPLKNLDHASEALADFYRHHPGAPRKINAVHFASMPWQSIFNITK